MMRLEKLDISELFEWVQLAKTQTHLGKVCDRIPKLAMVDPRWFAVHICCVSGQTYSLGDTARIFPLMSVIKSFSFLYLLEEMGADTVLQSVGIAPSDTAFNSLEQLISDRGHPRNPMINSGAITLADKLPGKTANDRAENLCQWLNQLANCDLHIDEAMLASVRASHSTTNQAIANYLAETGNITNSYLTLDTYEQICCISGTVKDLGLLGKLLGCQHEYIQSQHRQIVNSVMLTCGLYEASPLLAIKIGLPMKSGIGGGLLAIVPGEGAIACYSPTLDSIGNPIGAIAFVELLAQKLELSIFN
ncbi:MAG: glutaminase [Trichormus sp.]